MTPLRTWSGRRSTGGPARKRLLRRERAWAVPPLWQTLLRRYAPYALSADSAYRGASLLGGVLPVHIDKGAGVRDLRDEPGPHNGLYRASVLRTRRLLGHGRLRGRHADREVRGASPSGWCSWWPGPSQRYLPPSSAFSLCVSPACTSCWSPWASGSCCLWWRTSGIRSLGARTASRASGGRTWAGVWSGPTSSTTSSSWRSSCSPTCS